MTIYFIEMESSGAIKIGTTSASDVTQRMRQLQTGQPQKLRLIGTMEGGAEVERRLHEQFAEFRTNGEWFVGPTSFRWFIGFMCEQKLPWPFVRAYALLDAWREEVLSEISSKNAKQPLSVDAEIAWRDKQMNRQHRKNKELQRKLELLEAKLLSFKETVHPVSSINPAFIEPFEPAFYA